MQKIEITRDFFDTINSKYDSVLTDQLHKIFSEYGYYQVKNYYDALNVLERNYNEDLSRDLFYALKGSTNDNILMWLELVCASHYPKNQIVEWIIDKITTINDMQDITNEIELLAWFLCEHLRKLKQLKYLNSYAQILEMKKLSTSRIPIVSLLSYSKKKGVVEILLKFIDDRDINGHVLDALYRLNYENIFKLAELFYNDEREFVRKLSRKIIANKAN